MKEEVKLYRITFIDYTNSMNDTVSDYDDNKKYDSTFDDVEYIKIPVGGLIIKENEFDYYKKFGGGIKTMEYVGCMLVGDEKALRFTHCSEDKNVGTED